MKISIDESQEECPCCGKDIYDIYFVEEWGLSYCEECLDIQKEKWS
jgi:hypothetical protein